MLRLNIFEYLLNIATEFKISESEVRHFWVRLTKSILKMMLRWLIAVLVMELLFAAANSQTYPSRFPVYSDHLPPKQYPERPITPDYHPPAAGVSYHNPYTAHHKPVLVEYPAPQQKYCPNIGGLESQCRPAKDCAVWYDAVRATPGTACILENGKSHGICCPDIPLNGIK